MADDAQELDALRFTVSSLLARTDDLQRQLQEAQQERDEWKNAMYDLNRRAEALEAQCATQAAQLKAIETLTYDTVSTHAICRDRFGTGQMLAVNGIKQFGDNPSWVKVADIQAALSAPPKEPTGSTST